MNHTTGNKSKQVYLLELFLYNYRYDSKPRAKIGQMLFTMAQQQPHIVCHGQTLFTIFSKKLAIGYII